MRALSPGPLANQHSMDSLAASAYPDVVEYPADAVSAPNRFSNLGKVHISGLHMYLERRAGARVNLEKLGANSYKRFRVYVDNGQRKMRVQPTDLSLKDICVGSTQELANHGDRVDVTLCFDDVAVVLPAIAVRQDNDIMATAFIFTDSDGNEPSCANRHLDLIYHSLVLEVEKFRYGLLAYFMLSAAFSMLLVNWVFL